MNNVFYVVRLKGGYLHTAGAQGGNFKVYQKLQHARCAAKLHCGTVEMVNIQFVGPVSS